MDSMIQILEGLDVPPAPCKCKRGLGEVAPAAGPSPLWGIAALLAGAFAVEKLRKKK
jgi:hypothetical protein